MHRSAVTLPTISPFFCLPASPLKRVHPHLVGSRTSNDKPRWSIVIKSATTTLNKQQGNWHTRIARACLGSSDLTSDRPLHPNVSSTRRVNIEDWSWLLTNTPPPILLKLCISLPFSSVGLNPWNHPRPPIGDDGTSCHHLTTLCSILDLRRQSRRAMDCHCDWLLNHHQHQHQSPLDPDSALGQSSETAARLLSTSDNVGVGSVIV